MGIFTVNGYILLATCQRKSTKRAAVKGTFWAEIKEIQWPSDSQLQGDQFEQ